MCLSSRNPSVLEQELAAPKSSVTRKDAFKNQAEAKACSCMGKA